MKSLEGYLTLALGHPRYLSMAMNLARSLRYFDPGRPVCLVHDGAVAITGAASRLFDYFVDLTPLPGYVGCLNKIRAYEATPFERTMYVDADCLLVKDDISRQWNRISSTYFAMTGEKKTSGRWNNLDVERVCRELALPYVVQMNSGVFGFSRCAESARFFERLKSLYREHRDMLSNIHQSRAGQYADEPFFGTAMGEFGIEPVGGEDAGGGAWMISTWRARNCVFDPARGFSRIDKPSSYWFGLGQLPRTWVRHSPTIAHFISLKPHQAYEKTSEYFERELQAGRVHMHR